MTVIYHFPAELVHCARATFRPGRRTLNSSNPWTAFDRVQGPVDERWIAEITRATEDKAEWKQFEGFMMRVNGMAGFFSFPDPSLPYPHGAAAGGNPENGGTVLAEFDDATTFDDGTKFEEGATFGTVAQAAPAGANYLKIGGLVASQAISLAAGDKFSIILPGQNHGFLHAVVADVPSNSAGEALPSIWPRLRRPVAVDNIIQLVRPRGVFRLVQDDSGAVERDIAGHGVSGLSIIEAPEVLTL